MGGYLLPKAQVGDRIDYVLQAFPSLRRSSNAAANSQRRRTELLGIGRSLISSPKLLILDEPTAGLSRPWPAASLTTTSPHWPAPA